MDNLRLRTIPVSLVVPGHEMHHAVGNVNASPLADAAIAMLHGDQLAATGDSIPTYLNQHQHVLLEANHLAKISLDRRGTPMRPTIQPERAGVNESSPQSGIAQHATVQPSLIVDAKLVPPIFQKAPAISNITRVVVDVIQVQRGQRSVVDDQQQQFLFQLSTNPCDQPMNHGTQIRHRKSDAPRLNLVSVPTKHPVFGPIHADAHPVCAEIEEVIHGAGFAVVHGQRHESLDHLLHHLEMGAGFLSCVVVAVPVIPVPLNGAGAFSMTVMDHQYATHRDDARQNLGISMGGSPNPAITIPS